MENDEEPSKRGKYDQLVEKLSGEETKICS